MFLVLFQTEPGPVLEGQSDVSPLAVTSCLFMGDGVNDQSPRRQDSESAESGGVSAWLWTPQEASSLRKISAATRGWCRLESVSGFGWCYLAAMCLETYSWWTRAEPPGGLILSWGSRTCREHCSVIGQLFVRCTLGVVVWPSRLVSCVHTHLPPCCSCLPSPGADAV